MSFSLEFVCNCSLTFEKCWNGWYYCPQSWAEVISVLSLSCCPGSTLQMSRLAAGVSLQRHATLEWPLNAGSWKAAGLSKQAERGIIWRRPYRKGLHNESVRELEISFCDWWAFYSRLLKRYLIHLEESRELACTYSIKGSYFLCLYVWPQPWPETLLFLGRPFVCILSLRQKSFTALSISETRISLFCHQS